MPHLSVLCILQPKLERTVMTFAIYRCQQLKCLQFSAIKVWLPTGPSYLPCSNTCLFKLAKYFYSAFIDTEVIEREDERMGGHTTTRISL